MIRILTGLGAVLALATAASAQTSEQYAQLAAKTVSAWSCSALADLSKNIAEAERLFTLGRQSGTTVAEALKAGRVKPEDWQKHAPLLLSTRMAGPSTDFALGRAFEAVVTQTTGEVLKDTSDDNMRRSKASDMFRQRNCSVLR